MADCCTCRGCDRGWLQGPVLCALQTFAAEVADAVAAVVVCYFLVSRAFGVIDGADVAGKLAAGTVFVSAAGVDCVVSFAVERAALHGALDSGGWWRVLE